jgi:glucose/arabinose dehydrogenase
VSDVPEPSSRPTRRLPSAVALLVAVLVTVAAGLLAGCAHFPDSGPRNWRDKPDSTGLLAAPPKVPEQDPGESPPPEAKPPGEIPPPRGCDDQDPLVVATCLDPVSAIAILPGGEAEYVAQRATGVISRVEKGKPNQPIATVAVDAAGGGLKGLVLSPSFGEDRLLYGYAATGSDNRVVRITTDGQVTPVLTGIPRTPGNDGGGIAVGKNGELLVATASAGAASPTSLGGKILRIDSFGKPYPGNPQPSSTVYSSGLSSPGGLCTSPDSGVTWVTDRGSDRDSLYRVVPGQLGAAAWNWPDKPGAAGCVTMAGSVTVALRTASALFVLQTNKTSDAFTGVPSYALKDAYGHLSAAALSPAKIVWLGTENKGHAGKVTSSDDRVIRLPLLGGGSNGSGPD